MSIDEITPILNVSDMETSFQWFEKLGFTRAFEWRTQPDQPVTFGAVAGGGHEIFLCLGAQGGTGADGMWMSVFVSDVDDVYETCLREKFMEVASPPEDKPWGVREMHVVHPDGHTLRVGTGPEGG